MFVQVDCLDRGVRKIDGGGQTTGRSVYDGNGTVLRKYIYGLGINEPVCMINVANGHKYHYHYDGLGSITALSNVNGVIVERYSYDAFGEPNPASPKGLPTSSRYTTSGLRRTSRRAGRVSSVGNRFMFTGRNRWMPLLFL
jgi:hypothetical protein